MSFTNTLVEKVKNFYSPAHLTSVARETGFIKRSSKVTASMFLEMLLFKVFDNKTVSLNDHSVHLSMKHEVNVRKQSIDERFNEQCVEFIQTLLEQQIATQTAKNINVGCLKNFTSVKIKDSTRFQIPDNLKKEYPGSGGGASEAGVHIQFEFDLLSGKVSDLHVTDAVQQDSTDASETIEMIEAGSLILRDLGYFSSHVLEEIKHKKAYYISRSRHKMKIYIMKEGSYEELCLKKVHEKMKSNALLYQELNVFIGEKKKMPVRLIIETMPEQEVNKRLAKAAKEARKKGRVLSDRYKTEAVLNLFITNIPEQWVPTEQIRSLYRLRWQIELRFKTWKSFCNLDAFKKVKLHRFKIYLYASLLSILIKWEITTGLVSVVWQTKGKLLSIIKCYKALTQSAAELKEALLDPIKKLGKYLQKLYHTSIDQLMLEKRKEHLSQEEILLLKLEIKDNKC